MTRKRAFRIGKLNTAQDIFKENCKLFRRAAHGQIDPADAAKLSGILANSRQILDTVILDQKLSIIEEQLLKAVANKHQPILLNGAHIDEPNSAEEVAESGATA